jgi:hypothetical protein
LALAKAVRLIGPLKPVVNIQFLPQRKHNTSSFKIIRLMLFREVIIVYSENKN